MKKKLVSLLLCLVMVLSGIVMVGCAGEDDSAGTTAPQSGPKAMTLTLYSITGENTTDEAIQQVQDAINKITEARFNTHIILRLYPEQEYVKVIEEKIEAIEAQKAFEEAEAEAKKVAAKAAKAAGVTTAAETTSEETTVETDETMLGEFGLEKTVYPKEDGNQLDIFLVKGLDKYLEYIDRGVLSPLDEDLSVNSKILRDYVYPTFLDATRVGGVTYAIPNNRAVGEYQYFLINRELFDKYYFDPDSIKILTDLQEFVQTVGEKEKSYIPLLNLAGDIQTFSYPVTSPEYSFPSGETIFGGYVARGSARGTKAAPKDLLSTKQYAQTLSLLYSLNSSGYINTSGDLENSKFGVAIVNGDYSMMEAYEENYYVIPYKVPVFDNDTVFSSMYGVGVYTKNVARCMEIIKYFSINAELRNVFQYGAEGIHYEIDSNTGLVNIISGDYQMNPVDTGNQFLLWQNSTMSEAEIRMSNNNWEMAKLQNNQTGADPYLGFVIRKEPEIDPDATPAAPAEGEEAAEVVEYMSVEEILQGLDQLSATYIPRLSTFAPYTNADGVEIATYDDYLAELALEVEDNEYYLEATNPDNPNSIVGQYEAWYTANFGGEG